MLTQAPLLARNLTLPLRFLPGLICLAANTTMPKEPAAVQLTRLAQSPNMQPEKGQGRTICGWIRKFRITEVSSPTPWRKGWQKDNLLANLFAILGLAQEQNVVHAWTAP
jgi:hypothetical protein